jgi:hypothetical protein
MQTFNARTLAFDRLHVLSLDVSTERRTKPRADTGGTERSADDTSGDGERYPRHDGTPFIR